MIPAMLSKINGHGWRRFFSWFHKNQNVTIDLEVLSAFSDPDVVTLTYGATMDGMYRTKAKFDLISTEQEGLFFRKIYQIKWRTHSHAGRRNVVYDTDSTVVEKTWGIPYKVQ